ncbi:MAG: hypothetical protein DRP57_00045 [Spirochaetes bacterium]|nr:MAG: hypothetical protein DRP57_00045 [Spirochaetota bacterium]
MAERYVLFRVGEVRYAINLSFAVQILRKKNENILEVPRVPKYVDGVINVRGEVIPIINMREKFGLEKEGEDKKKRIVVIRIKERIYGLLVDDVREIAEIDEEVIEKEVTSVFGLKKNLIEGIAKIKDNLIVILRIEEVVKSEEEIKVAK